MKNYDMPISDFDLDEKLQSRDSEIDFTKERSSDANEKIKENQVEEVPHELRDINLSNREQSRDHTSPLRESQNYDNNIRIVVNSNQDSNTEGKMDASKKSSQGKKFKILKKEDKLLDSQNHNMMPIGFSSQFSALSGGSPNMQKL
jgi:hypothetical protein